MSKARHGGKFTFRICNADGVSNPTQACFSNPLNVELVDTLNRSYLANFAFEGFAHPSKNITYFERNGTSVQVTPFVFRVRLPANLVCKHCLFQVVLFEI